MRRFKQYLFVIALLLGSITISQAQSTKKMLIKGWSFSFDGIMEYLPEVEKQKMKQMPDDQRNMMKAMMEKSYIIFKKDGTMLAAMNKKEETMTWTLSENDTILTTTEENGKTTKLKIVKLTKNQLVLTEVDDDRGMKLVFKPKKD